MKLTYKILWFDNDPETFDSLADDIHAMKDAILGWGFIPDVQLVTDPQEFRKWKPFSEIDLVVVDFNLEEHGHGQDFINEIRSQSIFTEVIFYSAQAATELWDEVRRHQLEGVYISNRDSVTSRIEMVGQHTLRKVLDLENMRGIVMAEVGDLDLLLEEILMIAITGVAEDIRQEVFDGFHEDATRGVSKLHQGLEDFKNAPSIERLLQLCDSDKRWTNFNRIKKRHDFLKSQTFGNYQAEILIPRNFLAHGIPERQESGALRFNYRGKEYNFDENVSEQLRKSIISYRHLFTDIRDNLKIAGSPIAAAVEVVADLAESFIESGLKPE